MKKITTGKLKATMDEEFKVIFANITIPEFNELGFTFGDSARVKINDELIIEDIPYYSGYYSGIEELMLCGYPGDPFIKLARNCGDPTWFEFGMNEDSTIQIDLFEKGKFLEIEELYSLKYSDNPADFDSLEKFANFRPLHGGTLKPNYFYRSASPCDNWHKRGTIANQLIERYGIQCVLNLSNSEEKYNSFLQKDDFDSQYYHELYQNNQVLLLVLNVNYRSFEFKEKLGKGLLEMTKHDGPIVVHCAEGKDRTGFVCAVIMSLANVPYGEIIEDYMETYECYYHITYESNPKKYDAILDNIHDFLYSMSHADRDVPLSDIDLKQTAITYLQEGGLTEDEINSIIHYINQ